MCNGTWVCFDCRIAVRRPTVRRILLYAPWLIGDTAYGPVLCPCCRQPCHFIGTEIELPSKHDRRGWKRLRLQVQCRRFEALQERHMDAVRNRHDLIQQIRVLESRPLTDGRRKQVRQIIADLRGE